MLGRWLGMLLGGLLSCTANALEQTLPAEIHVASEVWENHSNADGTGLAWDLLRAVFEPAGVKLVGSSEPYTRSVGLAQRGKVDAALGMYRDEVGDLDFPRWPYAADRVVALGLTRLPKPTLQTLANYRLIWVRGYAFQDQLHSVGRYQEVQRREGIPAMLREGRADFYIDDDAEVDFLLASLEQPTDLQVTELQLLPLYLAFARTERGRALKQLYEQRMDVLVRSGSLRAIFNRWKDHYPYDSAQEPYHVTP